MSACTNVMEGIDSEGDECQMSEYRSRKEAIGIVEHATILFDNMATRSTSSVKINESDIYAIIGMDDGKETRSNSQDTLIYVVNFENDNGYALVSANRSTEGLIAITESGHLNPNDSIENEALSYYIRLATQYVASSHGPIDIEPDGQLCDTIFSINESAMALTPTWSQEYPFNSYCPNRVVGCGPLALAEILAYYNIPDTLELDFSTNFVTPITMDWPYLKQHTVYRNSSSNNYCSCPISFLAHRKLAAFVYQVGLECNAEYYPATETSAAATATCSFDVRNAGIAFGLHVCAYRPFSTASFIQPLRDGHLLLVGGETADGVNSHFWVVDGYRNMSMIITRYTISGPEQTVLAASDYNHINWGWNGKDNGFFLENVFNTANCTVEDEYGERQDDMNFSNSLEYIEFYH